MDPVTPPDPAGSGSGHPTGHRAVGWTVVMPLKASRRGKSRIDLDPELRRRLVLVMATDTVAAVARARDVVRVLLVVEDAADGAAVRSAVTGQGGPGAAIETHVTSARSLNDAIRDGVDRLGSTPGPVAVLPCDVPSATAGEIGNALAAAGRHGRVVVADADGTGTTLLAALRADELRPRYGPDSWRRHVADGAVPLDLPVDSGLRRDVDLRTDLAAVTGPATARTWRSTGEGAA